MNKPAPTTNRFSALNVLVDSWLDHLTATEVLVWLVIYRHADKDHLSRVGYSTIAKKLGHKKTNHVKEARKVLVRTGLLEVVADGVGRDVSVIRVLVPPVPGCTPQAGIPQIRVDPKPDSGSTPISVKGYTPNPGHKQNIEQNQSNSMGADAAAGEREDGVLPEVRRELELHKVSGRKLESLSRLLSAKNATPIQIRTVWNRVKTDKKTEKAVGKFITVLEDDPLPDVKLSAATIKRLVDAGEIIAIQGKPVKPKQVGVVRDYLAVYPIPCIGWDADKRPEYESVYVDGFDESDLTLSGHEQTIGEANAA